MSTVQLFAVFVTVLVVSGAQEHDPHDFVFPTHDDYPESHASPRFLPQEILQTSNDTLNEIPIELVRKLNEADDLDYILKNFVEGDLIQNRFEDVERTGVVNAKSAGCLSVSSLVDLATEASHSHNLTISPGDLLIPGCTRVNRCSGCCGNSLLACKPVPSGIETQLMKVLHVKYTGGPKFKLMEKVIIPVEVHGSCDCDCAITAKDCNPFQEYVKERCKCICKNSDERKKCDKQIERKLWDPKACRCACRQAALVCTTGKQWDERKCRCVRQDQRRR